jgi:hypothetical protein
LKGVEKKIIECEGGIEMTNIGIFSTRIENTHSSKLCNYMLLLSSATKIFNFNPPIKLTTIKLSPLYNARSANDK